MPEYHRESDTYLEGKVKLWMKVIQTVGFPIVICVWFIYKDWTQGKEEIRQRGEMTSAINSLTSTVSSLNSNILQQTRVLRHGRGDE